jgi:hypothetical protein
MMMMDCGNILILLAPTIDSFGPSGFSELKALISQGCPKLNPSVIVRD